MLSLDLSTRSCSTWTVPNVTLSNQTQGVSYSQITHHPLFTCWANLLTKSGLWSQWISMKLSRLKDSQENSSNGTCRCSRRTDPVRLNLNPILNKSSWLMMALMPHLLQDLALQSRAPGPGSYSTHGILNLPPMSSQNRNWTKYVLMMTYR